MCSYLCAGSGFYINKTCCANYRVDRLLCTSSFTNPSNHGDHKLFSYSAFIRFFQHTDVVPTRKLNNDVITRKDCALLAFYMNRTLLSPVMWTFEDFFKLSLNESLNKQLICRWYMTSWKLTFHTYSLEFISAHLEIDCNVLPSGQINLLFPSDSICRHRSESNRLSNGL